MTDHLSDLKIDRMLAGEVTGDERAELEAHASGCDRCGARLASIGAERDAFAERPLPIALGAATKQRRSRTWLGAPLAALAAAAVLVVVISRPADPARERVKGGGDSLLVSAGSPDRLRPVATGDVIRAGEHVQAGYTSTRDGYGAVLSIDGAGQASVYVPANGDAMVALPAGREASFPSSTLLDDVTGREVIAIAWCEQARPLAPLLAELKASGTVAAPAGCAVRVVTLDKRAAR